MREFGGPNLAMGKLLFDAAYVKFLAETHPKLHISQSSAGSPYFVSPLSCHEPLMPGVLRRLAYLSSLLVPSISRPRALVFGLPFEPYEQSGVLDALPAVSLMKKMAMDLGTELIFIPNVNASLPACKKLEAVGFFAIPSFPDMKLKLPIGNFTDYLSSRPAKYRQGIRRNIRRFENKKHRVLITKEISFERAEEVHEAYQFARRRAKVPWIAYEKAYFSNFQMSVPHAFSAVALSESGQFLGMAQGMQENELFHIARLATLERFHRQDAIFFRLIYAAIEHALAQGCQQISLAPTSYAFKRRLGAKMRPLSNLILPIGLSWRFLSGAFRPASFHQLLGHLMSQKKLEQFY